MAKILAVDDEEETLLFITGALKDNHEVITAESWLRATEHLLASQFDLIILDINLPGLSGDKLAQVMQKKFTEYPLNIVLFSGIEEAELQRKTEEVQAKGYIHKPCPADLFSLRIRRFLK
jgi:DNA-binding response OmpR family regulator